MYVRACITWLASGARSCGIVSWARRVAMVSRSGVGSRRSQSSSSVRWLARRRDCPSADLLVTEDGVEVDYTSNELQGVLAGILHGNGNYAERILGGVCWFAHPLLQEAREVCAGALSRRIHRHYRGFGGRQLLEATEKKTAKKALYVLRTALTGAHVLMTGNVVSDLTVLMDEHGFGTARELVQRKLAGERIALGGSDADHWLSEGARALALLDNAVARSVLPTDPANEAAVERWLLDVRKRNWA